MQLLLICGSFRVNSTNDAALNTVRATTPAGSRTSRFTGLAELPAFNPDADVEPLPRPVADLRSVITASDAVIFCTPEYAGSMPGSLKNLLDWTVGGTVLAGKPAAWLNVAAPGRGLGALAQLRTVLGYVEANIIEPACLDVPVQRDMVAADGTVEHEPTRTRLAGIWPLLSVPDNV
ncbi:MAG: putative NADPH-dependent reductase [Frankiales bacterium]|nr:putative NADPH-dependent reductase [Frankiales bacterium]